MSSPQMTRVFGFFGISWTFCVFCWAFCGTDPKLLSLPSQASEQRHGGELSKVTEVAGAYAIFSISGSFHVLSKSGFCGP